MDYGAIDLHKKESQIRIVTEGGEACCAKTRPEQEHRIGQTFGIPRSYLHGHSAELSLQTFCTFPREFSSLRRQGGS